MLNTSTVFYAADVLLLLLLLLCVYLFINNARARAAQDRKNNFLDRARGPFTQAIFDGTPPDITLNTSEEVRWAIEFFLSCYNDYEDPTIRTRLSTLADELFTTELTTQLASRRAATRQYALVVTYQLGMSTLDDKVAAINPRTHLEEALTAAIRGTPAIGSAEAERLEKILSGSSTSERQLHD